MLRIGALTDSSLIARPLGQLHQVNCASPAYIARYGMPTTLEDLDHHRIVHYVQTLGTKSPFGVSTDARRGDGQLGGKL